MRPDPVVVAHQVLANVSLSLLPGQVALVGIHSDFELRKTRSIGALSQQLPRRLMLWRMR